jgi:ubiquinone/menaquinone biosynthesis C-methylase UbiE
MTQEETQHNQVVRQQFSAQAAGFERHVLRPGSAHIMDWIMENLELQPQFRVLDVASGTALVARAIAPHVQEVVASDATPEMLDEARTQASAEGLTNISFEEGDAALLPYADGSFDLVTCRLGIHHFLEPLRQAREMVRVCRPGGHVGIFDITSTDVEEVAALHNELERMRDPSHTRAFTLDELSNLVRACELELTHTSLSDAEQILENWMDLTGTPQEARVTISEAMERELAGGPATGMQPFRRDGALGFRHSWAIFIGKKAGS